MLNGQGIVLAIMLFMYAITAISLARRIANPNLPETKTTTGVLVASIIIDVAMAIGAIYLASH